MNYLTNGKFIAKGKFRAVFLLDRPPLSQVNLELTFNNANPYIETDNLRVMEVQYHLHGRKYQTREEIKADYFHGLREFYFWEMPRIQYQNPRLQIVRILDKFPTPFIRLWFDDGKDTIIDCFNQSHADILNRLIRTAGKSEARLKLEETLRKEVIGEDNPALFGYGRRRYCGCEVLGQHPCPGVIRTPRFDQLEVDIGGKIV